MEEEETMEVEAVVATPEEMVVAMEVAAKDAKWNTAIHMNGAPIQVPSVFIPVKAIKQKLH